MSGCCGCKECVPKKNKGIKNAAFIIAHAGNVNVGKNAIFNQLTGVDQIVGNWPGKTVERAEGLLFYKEKRIRVNRPARHLFVLHLFDGGARIEEFYCTRTPG